MWVMRALICLVLSGCVSSDAALTATYGTGAALSMCDYGQTIRASDGGAWDKVAVDSQGRQYRLSEGDPLLGEHPGHAELSFGLIGALALETAAMWAPRVPAPVRWAVLGGVVVGEGYMVASNYQAGGVCGFGAPQKLEY